MMAIENEGVIRRLEYKDQSGEKTHQRNHPEVVLVAPSTFKAQIFKHTSRAGDPCKSQ